MKTNIEILSTQDNGDTLKVTGQGQIGKAEWSPWKEMTFFVPNTTANQRAYRVGRRVAFHLSPAREGAAK